MEKDVAVELAMLKAEVEGLRRLSEALALALLRCGAVPAEDLLLCLRAAGLNARFTASEMVELPLRSATEKVAAFAKSEVDPVTVVLAEAALFARERPERRAALMSWLSQAHPDEIEEDVRQLVERLLGGSVRRDAGDAPPPSAGSD